VDLNEALKQGAAHAMGGGRASGIRSALVVAEIALSVVLLAGAGLLIKSFAALNNVALGFRPEQVLVMDTSVQATSTVESQRRATGVFKKLLAGIGSLPGVSAAGATLVTPGQRGPAGNIWGDFLPKDSDAKAPFAGFSVIAPNTFAALGIPLKLGRDFDGRDSYDAPFTVIVNEALVREAFGRQDPLGHVVFCGLDDSTKPLRIIGVVSDFRQYGPAREPAPEIYLPYEQHPNNATALKLLIKTALAPGAFSGTLRRRVQVESPDVPVKFTTLEASLYQNLAAPRFRTLLLVIFAGLAVSLAMAGVYGVLAYMVGQRQGLSLAAIGLIAGLAGSFAVARVLTTILFEVKPTDPMTYAAVAGLLGLTTLAASYLPARRAARIDPLVTLRQE
jgi:hypothetical protein